MSITINKDSILSVPGSGGASQVNVLFAYKGYNISLSLDDSCGDSKRLFRGDFLVFKDKVDVTPEFFPDYTVNSVVPASSQQLHDIFKMIDARV